MNIEDAHLPGGKFVYRQGPENEMVQINYKEIVRLKLAKEEALKELKLIKEEREIALRIIKEHGLLQQVFDAIARETTKQRWEYIVDVDENGIVNDPAIEYNMCYKHPGPRKAM